MYQAHQLFWVQLLMIVKIHHHLWILFIRLIIFKEANLFFLWLLVIFIIILLYIYWTELDLWLIKINFSYLWSKNQTLYVIVGFIFIIDFVLKFKLDFEILGIIFGQMFIVFIAFFKNFSFLPIYLLLELRTMELVFLLRYFHVFIYFLNNFTYPFLSFNVIINIWILAIF